MNIKRAGRRISLPAIIAFVIMIRKQIVSSVMLLSAYLAAEADGYMKNVILEEFSTERCSNCPSAAQAVEKVLAQRNSERPGSVVAVVHHAGFYTDWLTSPSSLSLLDLYNGDQTFAPGFMVDRARFDDEESVVFANYNDGALLEERVSEMLAREAGCLLAGMYDIDVSSGVVNVRVSGERTDQDVCADSRISVYLLENDIPARYQQGAPEGFVHQHALREVNDAWGEPIQWDGTAFEYRCTLPLDKVTNVENIAVAAFVNRYDRDDFLNCGVENSILLTSADSHVSDLSDDGDPCIDVVYRNGRIESRDSRPVTVMDMDGRILSNENLLPGIYIVQSLGKAFKIKI